MHVDASAAGDTVLLARGAGVRIGRSVGKEAGAAVAASDTVAVLEKVVGAAACCARRIVAARGAVGLARNAGVKNGNGVGKEAGAAVVACDAITFLEKVVGTARRAHRCISAGITVLLARGAGVRIGCGVSKEAGAAVAACDAITFLEKVVGTARRARRCISAGITVLLARGAGVGISRSLGKEAGATVAACDAITFLEKVVGTARRARRCISAGITVLLARGAGVRIGRSVGKEAGAAVVACDAITFLEKVVGTARRAHRSVSAGITVLLARGAGVGISRSVGKEAGATVAACDAITFLEKVVGTARRARRCISAGITVLLARGAGVRIGRSVGEEAGAAVVACDAIAVLEKVVGTARRARRCISAGITVLLARGAGVRIGRSVGKEAGAAVAACDAITFLEKVVGTARRARRSISAGITVLLARGAGVKNGKGVGKKAGAAAVACDAIAVLEKVVGTARRARRSVSAGITVLLARGAGVRIGRSVGKEAGAAVAACDAITFLEKVVGTARRARRCISAGITVLLARGAGVRIGRSVGKEAGAAVAASDAITFLEKVVGTARRARRSVSAGITVLLARGAGVRIGHSVGKEAGAAVAASDAIAVLEKVVGTARRARRSVSAGITVLLARGAGVRIGRSVGKEAGAAVAACDAITFLEKVVGTARRARRCISAGITVLLARGAGVRIGRSVGKEAGAAVAASDAITFLEKVVGTARRARRSVSAGITVLLARGAGVRIGRSVGKEAGAAVAACDAITFLEKVVGTARRARRCVSAGITVLLARGAGVRIGRSVGKEAGAAVAASDAITFLEKVVGTARRARRSVSAGITVLLARGAGVRIGRSVGKEAGAAVAASDAITFLEKVVGTARRARRSVSAGITVLLARGAGVRIGRSVGKEAGAAVAR